MCGYANQDGHDAYIVTIEAVSFTVIVLANRLLYLC